MAYNLEGNVNGTRMGNSQQSFFSILKSIVQPKALFAPL